MHKKIQPIKPNQE